MTLGELQRHLGLALLTTNADLSGPVTGGCVSDLLSWAIGNAKAGDAWITVHTHVNIVGVAYLKDVACVILPAGLQPEPVTLAKASEEGVALFSSEASAYELAGRIWALLNG